MLICNVHLLTKTLTLRITLHLIRKTLTSKDVIRQKFTRAAQSMVSIYELYDSLNFSFVTLCIPSNPSYILNPAWDMTLP